MNRFFIAALALFFVPSVAAFTPPGPLDEIIHPPGEACEGAAEWTGPEDLVQVGVVWDSHNCGGIGYRFGENVDCGLTIVPCEGWIWLYGGATGVTSQASMQVPPIDPWGQRACEDGAKEVDLGTYSVYVIEDHNCGGVGWKADDNIRCHPDFWYVCGGWIWFY